MQKTVILGTANVLLHHRGLTYPVRALLDSGSEVSCISQSLRRRLGLPTTQVNISLLGVNSQVTANATRVCAFSLGPTHDKNITFECSAFVLPRISGNLPSTTIEWLDSYPLPDLRLADKTFYRSSQVDVLIGADLYPSIMLGGLRQNVFGSLLAQETAFGWILTGQLPTANSTSPSVSVHFTTTLHQLADDVQNTLPLAAKIPRCLEGHDYQATHQAGPAPSRSPLNVHLFFLQIMAQETATPMTEEALLDFEDSVSLTASRRSPSPTLSSASQVTVVPCDPPPKSAAQVARVLPRRYCAICRKEHFLRHCNRFQRMTLEQRLRTVVKFGYCVRCLSLEHVSRACRSRSRCHKCNNVDHNTMLHDDDLPLLHASDLRPRRAATDGLSSHSARTSLRPTVSTQVRSVVLLPTCVCFLYFQGHRYKIRALLDSCAESSRLSLAGLRAIGLTHLTGSFDQLVDVVVASTHRPDSRFTIVARVVRQLDVRTPSARVSPTMVDEFALFRLADETFGTPGDIHMVLGGDVCSELMRPRRLALPGLPNAQESVFGWVLSGPCKL